VTAIWVCHAVVIRDSEQLPALVFASSMQRVVSGVCFFNASFCSVCNILVMVVHCITFYWNAAGKSALQVSPAHWCALEIGITMCIVLSLVAADHFMWAVARHTLDIKSSSRSEVTVRRLLSGLCDAVVALGPDLHISARAPKLANLLLKHHSASALEGANFLQFMAESDQLRFRDFIARAPDHAEMTTDPEPAQALNVHLNDSAGGTVQVQLFHSNFTDLNDKISHLIGICELEGTTSANNNPRMLPGSFNKRAGQHSASESCGNTIAFDSEPSLMTFEDSTSESTSFDNSRPAAPEKHVDLSFSSCRFTVNQLRSRAPVLDASLLGRERLLQWITEWTSTRAWMQDFMNAVLRPINAESWPKGAGPPHSLSVRLALRADCRLPPDFLNSPVPAEDSAGRSPPARLTVGRVALSMQKKAHPAKLSSLTGQIYGVRGTHSR